MQRVHDNDLTGALLRASDEWTLLKLPAIAEQEEKIQIGTNQYHIRRVGDVLHAERDPLPVLESMRSQIGSSTFAAQWQQAPLPPEGVIIKREWVRRYERLPEHGSGSQVIQSWDTASKPGELSDYTVCTTWLYHEKKYYLVHVFRDRIDYPTLKARAIALASEYKAGMILIEDAGVGIALVPELQQAGLPAIAVKPELDKCTRMAVQVAKFESGQVFFPAQVAWLDPLEAELFAFPGGAHDDQVDSISQALAHKISTYDPYNDEVIKGFQRFTEGLLMDQYWGRVTGRPW
jgi:predicted phage terminase large subunit-like protein